MDAPTRPTYSNPSTTYLNGSDADHYYYDEEPEFKYPPVQLSKPNFDDEEAGFGGSQHALTEPHAIPQEPKKSWFKRYIPSSTACRLYLLVVLLQTAVDVGMEADILVEFDGLPQSADRTNNMRRLPVYLGIFAFAHLFQFVLAIDAVIFRNTLQFIFLSIFNALLLLYACVQISELRGIFPPNQTGFFSKVPITVLTDIIPAVIGAAQIAYIGLGYKIYTEFGWKTYKFLGADRRIKRMYGQYQIFESMIKFDVFFWLGFSIQFIGLILNHSDFEFGLTIAVLPMSMLLLLHGHLAAKYEHKWMMWSFLFGLLAGFCYFTYKLAVIILRRNQSGYFSVWKTLSVFTAVSIVVLITTFISSIVVLMNFGQGLKVQLAKSKEKKSRRTKSEGIGGLSMSAHPHRMSID